MNNDDGITIIDISDLASLRYCFAFLRGTVKPLEASRYLWYYEKPHQEDSEIDSKEDSNDGESWDANNIMERQREVQAHIQQHPLVQQLENHRMIDPEVLSSWAEQQVIPNSKQGIGADADKAVEPSLRDQAMDQLIYTLRKIRTLISILSLKLNTSQTSFRDSGPSFCLSQMRIDCHHYPRP